MGAEGNGAADEGEGAADEGNGEADEGNGAAEGGPADEGAALGTVGLFCTVLDGIIDGAEGLLFCGAFGAMLGAVGCEATVAILLKG